MSRKLLFIVLAGVFVCLPLASVQALVHVPTETIYHNPATAYNGITIVTPFTNNATYLIDNDGRQVHKIPSTLPIWHAEACDNGNFSRTVMVPQDMSFDPAAFLSFMGGWHIQEVTWYGAKVKELNSYTSQFGQHHDFQRTYNKKLKAYTYMFVAYTFHTKAEGLALGAAAVDNAGWSPDAIVEMNYAGEVVWMWQFYHHTCSLNSVSSPYGMEVADLASAPGRLNISVPINGGTTGNPSRDWTHVNSMDYNQDLDYVMCNSRSMNEFFVINHGKTFVRTVKDPVTGWQDNIDAAAGPDGDFVYRFGCPSNYNQGAFPAFGTNGTTQIYGAHQGQWIHSTAYKNGPALPGAGHFTIFDNGATNNNPVSYWTKIPEINPFVSGAPVNGAYPTSTSYVNPPAAGYKTVAGGFGGGGTNQSNQIIWTWATAHPTSMTSMHISGTQRLPNGNQLTCSGEYGHFVEITNAKALTWEYVNPIYNGKPVKYITDPSMSTPNQVFRCYKYDVNHPAFKKYVTQYSDGSLVPIHKMAGDGYTLTGSVPCRSIPCAYVGAP
jgi:hypothetical protein